MAAVIELSTARRIHSTTGPTSTGPGSAAATARHLPVGSVPEATAPPRLRVIQGGRSERAVQLRRTYLRRRLLVVTVLVLLVLGAAHLLSAVGGALASPAVPAPAASAATYDVAPGETLWSIAGQVLPGGDRRDAVDRLIEANPWLLESGTVLRAGDVLRVPAR